MGQDLPFACRCGAFTGVLHEAGPDTGCHLVCYCADCRAAARHFGVADKLEPGGGSPLIQVLPSRIEITGGAEHLACMRLSPKGLHRWYAACCNTPVATTVGSSRMPLAGLWRPNFPDSDAFGPVVTRAFTKMAELDARAPRKDRGLVRMLGSLVVRAAGAYMAGTARRSPFFRPDGAPAATPVVITPEERRAAYGR